MTAFGHMVWATLGPQNELFHEAMENVGPVIEWVEQLLQSREPATPTVSACRCSSRPIVAQITQDEAKLLVGILLSAAADTTVMTVSTAMRAFSLFPDQYRELRRDPSLARSAFEESLRWDSPSRMAGRIAMRDVEIDGYVIPKGERCGLMFAAANRDPRKWTEPDRFDIRRDLRGHLGWGYGVHACVGRIARAARSRCAARRAHQAHRTLRACRRAGALDDDHRSWSGPTTGPNSCCMTRQCRTRARRHGHCAFLGTHSTHLGLPLMISLSQHFWFAGHCPPCGGGGCGKLNVVSGPSSCSI